jgi:hypothetical protein
MDEERRYPLQRKWKIWEMWEQNKQSSATFTEKMQTVGEFDTIFTFWQHWNYFPHSDPSKLFEDPETKIQFIVEGLNRSIEAIGVFANGVKPAWEDEINVKGSDLCVRRAPAEYKRLKEYWDQLVISVIGENLPFSEEIVGCRVVDKKNNFKFELWLKFDANSNDAKTAELKNAFGRIFGVGAAGISVASHKH